MAEQSCFDQGGGNGNQVWPELHRHLSLLRGGQVRGVFGQGAEEGAKGHLLHWHQGKRVNYPDGNHLSLDIMNLHFHFDCRRPLLGENCANIMVAHVRHL